MNEQMEFPLTFEKFAKEYGFKDDKEVYTNGSDLIPIFRVKQWLEHVSAKTQMIDKSNFDVEQYKIDLQCAYDCGKHANKWIPVTEKNPGIGEHILVCLKDGYIDTDDYYSYGFDDWKHLVVAWQPLPEPYKGGE